MRHHLAIVAAVALAVPPGAVTLGDHTEKAATSTVRPLFEPLDPHLRNVRGVNFIPTYPSLDGTKAFPYFGVASHTAMWAFYGPDTRDDVLQQLRWARATGFNTVRVFLSYVCWQYHDEYRVPGVENEFLANWDDFLSLCEQAGVRALPVVWDFVSLSTNYAEPDYTGRDRLHSPANISYWHDSPGRSRALEVYGKNFPSTSLGRFVTDCARVVDRHHPDVLLTWDAANEPYVGNDPELGPKSQWFVAQTMALLKRTRPTDRVMVSSGVNDRCPVTIAWANDQNCDVIGIHAYGPNTRDLLGAFIYDATFVNGPQRPLGKPVIATEVGYPGAGFSYPDTANYCRTVPRLDLPAPDNSGVGFCTWMLMIGHTDRRDLSDDKHPFKHGTGLFYGHIDHGRVMVRDLSAVNAFVTLAKLQGVDPATLWGGNGMLQQLVEMRPDNPLYVDPMAQEQLHYPLSQRWVQNHVLRASRADFKVPSWSWHDYRSISTMLREMVHPNLDLKNVVSLRNGNPIRRLNLPQYDISPETLARLQWFRAAAQPGTPEFQTMLTKLEQEHSMPAGSLRPWDATTGRQAHDLEIVFADFLHPFAQTLAPFVLPR